jgi:phosphohistidine phosphatase SixA
MSRILIAAISVLLATVVVAQTTAPPATGPAAALAALKAGGAVLVMRHGATNSNQADVDPLHLEDCTKQRQLNQAGRAAASQSAVLLWLHGVVVSNVTTSRYCRAIETGARIAEPFGLTPSATDDFAEGGQVVTPTENRRRAAAMQAAANSPPPAPGNAFIVSHKPNIVDAFGCEFLNVSEGEMAVFKPSATGAQLVGRLKVADLVALLP